MHLKRPDEAWNAVSSSFPIFFVQSGLQFALTQIIYMSQPESWPINAKTARTFKQGEHDLQWAPHATSGFVGSDV
jgi:hypothetical protein